MLLHVHTHDSNMCPQPTHNVWVQGMLHPFLPCICEECDSVPMTLPGKSFAHHGKEYVY